MGYIWLIVVIFYIIIFVVYLALTRSKGRINCPIDITDQIFLVGSTGIILVSLPLYILDAHYNLNSKSSNIINILGNQKQNNNISRNQKQNNNISGNQKQNNNINNRKNIISNIVNKFNKKKSEKEENMDRFVNNDYGIDYPQVETKNTRDWQNNAYPAQCFSKYRPPADVIMKPEMGRIYPNVKFSAKKKYNKCTVHPDYVPNNMYQGWSQPLPSQASLMEYREDRPYMQSLQVNANTFNTDQDLVDKYGHRRWETYDELTNKIVYPGLPTAVTITPERVGADPNFAIEQFQKGGKFYFCDNMTDSTLKRSVMRRNHKLSYQSRGRELFRQLYSDPWDYKEMQDWFSYEYSDIIP